MKIALVAQAVNTHSGSRAPIELAKQFVKFGHEVTFFAHARLSGKKAINELRSAKIKVVEINYPKIKFIDQYLAAFLLAKRLRKLKPNLISAHTAFPFMLGSKLSQVPIFTTYHGTQQDVWIDKIFPKKPNVMDKLINNFLNNLIKFVMFAQLSLSDRIVTISKYCSDELKTFYGKQGHSIFWGSAPPHLIKNKLNPKRYSSINLLSVSRIVPYKGFHILINILKDLGKQHKNLKLTIIGSHPDKKYLSYLKKIKPDNVEIIVDATDATLANHYQKADIYATCDKFLFFGEPIMEAAEFGIPSIALNHAAAKEVIKSNKTGYVVKNSEEFKKALTILIKSPQKRLVFGKNAQKFAKEYTWEKCAQNYLKLFEKWQNN